MIARAGRARRRARSAALLAILALAPFARASVPGGSEPGTARVAAGGGADSVVLVFPARLSASLLTLRVSAPLAVASALPPEARGALLQGAPPPGAATVLRRDVLDPRDAGPPAAGDAGDRLTVSGSKSFSVEIGRRRDASLSQALDLTLRGRVAGDVDLSATLSDRALPFEPDGTTRELDDLDRISLGLRAPGGEATLGDFRFETPTGEFARVRRELEGVRGAATLRGTHWDVTAAGAKGERRTAEFRGEEGKQGPYILTARLASSGGDGGIVAGSETVWLDGARLRRGADADYVLDYAAGTITFTVRRPIASVSRIAVDFEEAAAQYRRQLYAAATRGGGTRGSWYAAFLREGDDWKRPFGAELTSDDRRALASAGDSASAPLPSGVRAVGSGKGSYRWDETDPATPRWVYVGAGHGDYEVEFAAVGAGRGAYGDTLAVDGARFYRYVGSALGSYAPGRALAVPSAAGLMDAGGTFRIGSSLAFDAEIARSSFDQNLLSRRDDGDNGGIAARGALRLDPRPVRLFGRGLGTFRTALSVRTLDARFAPIDRLDTAFESERWNQKSDASGEKRYEATFQYDPAASVSLRGEWGHRRVEGGARSNRRAAEAEWRGLVAGIARWEEARNDGSGGAGLRSRWSIDVGRDRGLFQPRLRAGDERVAGAGGDSLASRASRFATGAFVVAPSASVRLRGGATWRQDRETPSILAERKLRSVALDGGATIRAEILSVDAAVSHRRARGDAGRTETDLAQVAVTAGRAGSAVTSEIRWDVSQSREPERLRSLVPVGAGLGSYDATGTLAPAGGYEFVSAIGADATRTRATWQLRLDAYPGRAVPASASTSRRALWRAFGGSTLLRLESQSRLPLGRLDRAFRFGDYLEAGTTVHGTWSGRQTLEFVPWGARYDVRLEAGSRREVVGDLANLRVSNESRDVSLRFRHPLPARLRLSERLSADRTRYESARSDTPDRTRGAIRGRGAEVELTRAFGPPWNLGIIGRHRRDVDRVRGGSQTTWSAGPTLRAAAGGKLRVDARALWASTERRGEYAPPGAVIVPVLGDRLDYDLLGEMSLRERLQLSFAWNGSAVPGQSGTYTARIELRSSF